jgi:membrane-bound ClpP family serine protease
MSILFWPSLFLAIGLLLLLVEAFIPSGGLIGLCSIICVLLSLWYAFAQSTSLGAMFMVVDLVAVPLTAFLTFTLWTRSPLGRRLMLKPPSSDEIQVSHTDLHLEHLVGQDGRALTPLRPSGYIEIDDRRIGSLAEEGFLPSGSAVRVIAVRSGQLIVRGLHDPSEVHSDNHPESTENQAPQTGSSPIFTTASAVSILDLEDAP